MLEATNGKTAAAGQGAPRCGDCRFHDPEKMWCRRRGPGAIGYWPHAALQDWCGEFEPKPPAMEGEGLGPGDGEAETATKLVPDLETRLMPALRRCGECGVSPKLVHVPPLWGVEAQCARAKGQRCATSDAVAEGAVARWNREHGETGGHLDAVDPPAAGLTAVKRDASPENAALEGDHALRRCGTCWAKPTIQSTQHAGESEVFYFAEAKCERPALCGSFCSAPSAASEEEAVAQWNQTYGDTGDHPDA